MNRKAALLRKLNEFKAADAQEAEHLRGMQALLAAPGNVFDRAHWQPGHFTASAFVLAPNEDALLLILHGKLHRWLQPGGHIDADDADVEAAARREVAEEVGIRDMDSLLGAGVPFDVDVHTIPARCDDPAHAHFDVRFLYRARSLQMRAGSDAKAARWVALSEVASLESDASVLRAVAKLRR